MDRVLPAPVPVVRLLAHHPDHRPAATPRRWRSWPHVMTAETVYPHARAAAHAAAPAALWDPGAMTQILADQKEARYARHPAWAHVVLLAGSLRGVPVVVAAHVGGAVAHSTIYLYPGGGRRLRFAADLSAAADSGG